MLLLASIVAAATPAENALYAWADKCPSTAMGAGLYQGTDHASVTVGERTVLRVRTRDAGASPGGSATETLWMLAENCRAVGLVEQHGKQAGLRPGVAGFVVAKEGGVPTASEQATLLAWAGKSDWDRARPEHAVATATFTPPPSAEAPGGGIEGKLFRLPGRVWRDGPAPAQLSAWQAGTSAPDGAVCPCWQVVRPGEPTVSRGARTTYAYGGPVGPGVTLVEEAGRWAVETRPPTGGKAIGGTAPAALAGLDATWWPAPAAGGATLAVTDPATGASFVLQLPSAGPLAWSAGGIALGGGKEIAAATVRAWLAP